MHKKRIPEGAKPFLTAEELGSFYRYEGTINRKVPVSGAAKIWAETAHKEEAVSKRMYNYIPVRQEGGWVAYSKDGIYASSSPLEKLHGISILDDIEKRVGMAPNGRKIRVLDVGAGVGAFTEQIREKFGDRIKVYSTGLSKAAAKKFRKKVNSENSGWNLNGKISEELHPDDLKWRSVKQLSDFEEFDVIVDTVGEGTSYLKDGEGEVRKSLSEYLHIITRKLLPGGLASIVFMFDDDLAISIYKLKEIIREIIEQDFFKNVEWAGFEENGYFNLRLWKPIQ